MGGLQRHLPRVLPPLQLVPLLGTLANRCSAHVFGRYPRRTPAKSIDTAFRGSSALTSLQYPFLSAQRTVLSFKCGDAALHAVLNICDDDDLVESFDLQRLDDKEKEKEASSSGTKNDDQ
ncbi:hypothetical protein PIB30_102159 [Stylosanthes scabra]|uniref:Uncharacterized protein n=1 Tax=Stylosanthes scabra TaxID=79078 RepID=A0ABU6YXY4_9FABA|nr:hypothetical protein [Stylosanthes scabra]